MSHPSSSPAPDEPLSWLAFRYVANELTDAEAAQFELRLENDQAAREAVAAAVELTQTMAWVEREETPAPLSTVAGTEHGRRYLAAFGWLLAGSLACLVGLTIVNHFRGARVGEHEGMRQLALAWSETRRDAEFADGGVFLDADAAPSAALSNDQGLTDRASSDPTAIGSRTGDELQGDAAEDGADGDQDEAMADSSSDPMASISRATPSWMMAAVAEGDASGASSKTRDEAKTRGEERPATQER